LDAFHRPAFDVVIDDICQMQWEYIHAEDLIRVAKVYYFFSIQFRESLEIACRLRPEDEMLKKLWRDECNTDNLSPWPSVAKPGEKLNHDEFMRRLLSLQPITGDEHDLDCAGRVYFRRIHDVDEEIRAASIASYEDGGLSRVFRAMLRAKDWEGQGQSAFRFFLEQHIRFDAGPEDGHGALARHLRPDDRILPLWVAFKEMLTEAVPKLACGWAGARALSSRGEQRSIYD
jgi:hypothetical protein